MDKNGRKAGRMSQTASVVSRASPEGGRSRSASSKDQGRAMQTERDYERHIAQSLQSALETNRKESEHRQHVSNSPLVADRPSRSLTVESYGQRGSSLERRRDRNWMSTSADEKGHHGAGRDTSKDHKSNSKQSSTERDRPRDADRRSLNVPPPFDERISRQDLPSNRMHTDDRCSLLSGHSSRSPVLRDPSSERGSRGRASGNEPRDRHGRIIEPLVGRPRTPPPIQSRILSPNAHRHSHQSIEGRYQADWPPDSIGRGSTKGQMRYSPDQLRGLQPSPSRRDGQFASRQYDENQVELLDYGRREDRCSGAETGRDSISSRQSLDRGQRRSNFPPVTHPGRSVMDTYERASPRPRSDFVLDNRRTDQRIPPDRWGNPRDLRLTDAPIREPGKRRDDVATASSRKRGAIEPAERPPVNAKRRCVVPSSATSSEPTQKSRDSAADQRRGKGAQAGVQKATTKSAAGAPPKGVSRDQLNQTTLAPKNIKAKDTKGSPTKPASKNTASPIKAALINRRANVETKETSKVVQPSPSKTGDAAKRKRISLPSIDHRPNKQAKSDPKTESKEKHTVPIPPKPLMSITAKPPLRKPRLKPVVHEPKSPHSDSRSVRDEQPRPAGNEPKVTEDGSKPDSNAPKSVVEEPKESAEDSKLIVDEPKSVGDETSQVMDELKDKVVDSKAEVSEDEIPKNLEDQHVIDCAGSFSDWSDDSQDLLNKDVETEVDKPASPKPDAEAEKSEMTVSQPTVSEADETSEKASVEEDVKAVAKSTVEEAVKVLAAKSPIPPTRVEKIKEEESRRSVSSERSVQSKRKTRSDGAEDSSRGSRDNRTRDRDRDRARESTFGHSSRSSSRHTSLERGSHRSHHDSDRERSSFVGSSSNDGDSKSNAKEMATPIEGERMKLPDMGEGVVIDSVGPDPGDKISDLEGYEYDPISDEELDAMMDDTDDHRAGTKTGSAEDGKGTGIMDVLEVDWASLVSEKQTLPRSESKQHVLEKFSAAHVLSRIGVSVAYAGTALLGRIEEHIGTAMKSRTKSDVKDGVENGSNPVVDEVPRFKFDHDVAAIHAASRLQKQELNTIYDSVGVHRRALSARHDLYFRKRLCQLNQKKLESLPLFTAQNFDCELLRQSLQLFKIRVSQGTS